MMQGLQYDDQERLLPKDKIRNLKPGQKRASHRGAGNTRTPRENNNASKEDLEDQNNSVQNQGAQPQPQQSGLSNLWKMVSTRILWFQIYFVVQVVFSVIMISYYIMLAAKPRDVCTVQVANNTATSTENVSGSLTASFVAGFFLHLINFTVNTFVEPCVRLVAMNKENQQ